MRAAFLHGPRDLRIGFYDVPDADADAGRMSVWVAGVGVCGTDLHYYQAGGIGSAAIDEPFIPGHEFAGRLEVDVPAHGLRAGQLVAVDPARPCDDCEWCDRGHVNLCPHVVFTGAPPVPGAMRESITVGPDQIHALPEAFSVAEAVMLEPLGVAIHALDIIKPRFMETVGVVGCGPIGLCLAQLARLAGASRVYAVDPVDYRARAAGELAADRAATTLDAIDDWTDGRGVDCVLEATNSPDGFESAVTAARIGGRILLAGIPDRDRYAVTASRARRKGLAIKFCRRMGHVYPRAIDLVARGRVDVASIVSHRLSLSDAETAFEYPLGQVDEALKTMVLPNDGQL